MDLEKWFYNSLSHRMAQQIVFQSWSGLKCCKISFVIHSYSLIFYFLTVFAVHFNHCVKHLDCTLWCDLYPRIHLSTCTDTGMATAISSHLLQEERRGDRKEMQWVMGMRSTAMLIGREETDRRKWINRKRMRTQLHRPKFDWWQPDDDEDDDEEYGEIPKVTRQHEGRGKGEERKEEKDITLGLFLYFH